MKLLVIFQCWSVVSSGVSIASQIIECRDAAHAALIETTLRQTIMNRRDLDVTVIQLPDAPEGITS